jgi:hypothetical protein
VESSRELLGRTEAALRRSELALERRRDEAAREQAALDRAVRDSEPEAAGAGFRRGHQGVAHCVPSFTPDPPGAPSDATSLTELLASLATQGFHRSLCANEDGTVAAGDGTWELADADVEVRRRLEGASDPADMVMVLGLHHRPTDERGVLVLAYGPEASPAEAELLQRLAAPLKDAAAPAVVTADEAGDAPSRSAPGPTG